MLGHGMQEKGAVTTQRQDPHSTCSLGVVNPTVKDGRDYAVIDTGEYHDSLSFEAVTLLALSLSFALAICLMGCPTPVREMFAGDNVHTITETGKYYSVSFEDEEGHTIPTYNAPVTYTDEEGTVYRCIDPNHSFKKGEFFEVPLKIYQDESLPTDDLIHKCALIEYWCNNVKGSQPDYVVQTLIWKAIYEIGPGTNYRITKCTAGGEDLTAIANEFNAWFEANKDNYKTSGSFWRHSTSNNAQDVMHFTVESITLTLKKTSAQPKITDGNASYSLAGAEYAIYNNQECTQPENPPLLITKEDGVSDPVNLTPGTYYVKETKPSRGYLLDEEVHTVEVTGKSATLEVTEEPTTQSVDVWVKKIDAELQSQAQGSGTLEGAKFRIAYYREAFTSEKEMAGLTPLASWTKTSDENGEVKVEAGDIKDISDSASIPYGTITIQEIEPPAGYLLEGQQKNSPNDYMAPIHICPASAESGFIAPTIEDGIRRAGLYITKADKELDNIEINEGEQISRKGKAQGGASLAGIEFEVISTNDNPVMVNGDLYNKGDTVCTLTTDSDGIAKTEDDETLPVGTYEVKETASNGSYKLDTHEPIQVTIDEEKSFTYVHAGIVEDTVIRGGLHLQKVSRETLASVPQGNAKLDGATFVVTNANDNDIVYNNATIAPNQDIMTLITDEHGVADTAADALPYGTYNVQEVSAPEGYLSNDSWNAMVSITEDGVIVNVLGDDKATGTTNTPVSDQIIRNDIRFLKKDAQTQQPLANVPFKITSVNTGEWHIVMTDANGVLSTAANQHSHLTNENDRAYSDGSLDVSALKADAGIWFSGTKDASTVVSANDSLGALPYDTYTIEELQGTSNQGKRLISFDVTIDEADDIKDHGVVENHDLPSIKTLFTNGGYSQTIAANKTYQLTDWIEVINLEKGHHYTLNGYVYAIKGNQKIDDNKYIASKTIDFTAEDTTYTCEMPFEVNTSELGGHTLLACQYLTENGKPVAIHNSADDMNQTINVTELSTLLTIAKRTSASGNTQSGSASGNKIILDDMVTLENLRPGETYELTGTLYDKQTGKEITDKSGNVIHGTACITPLEPTYEAHVKFEVDESIVSGRTVVAFEELTCFDLEAGQHKDINDIAQTVSIPKISTTLSDTEGHHILNASESIHLIDTVVCSGLAYGENYRLVGMLMDRTTGKPLKNEAGGNYTSTVNFKADEKTSKTVQVAFDVKAEHLKGTAVVCFEELFIGDTLIASHNDLSDQAQTVFFPSIATELTDKDHKHETEAAESLALVDAVKYTGLRTDVTYTLIGTLHDAESGNELKNKNNEPIQASCSFQPKEADGKAEVAFSLNASELGGKKVVAFERLVEGKAANGRELAKHADRQDQLQIVTIKAKQTTPDDPQQQQNQQTPEETTTQPTTSNTDLPTNPTPTNPTPTPTGSTPTTDVSGGSAATPHTGDDSFIVPLVIFCTAAFLIISSILVRAVSINSSDE